ncbi:uncharacterized protein F4822DRAFT_324298 [Hypoxylon trugodes]|uniref:uncharacterized protein n=1 Tax=Hypoxylon trugodes TaxID=326681 RepID=UPI0021980B26|nr:uncharacterized protein F4822DRAFT_324298 [Hypoxylon trugodes]KAI1386689.1 hypothetical protein F4822DRAFT_324298 [Hypoxylon trugodes]
MWTSAAFLTLPIAVLASGSVPDGPWTAGVWRVPATDDVFFNGDAINASGGKFYVNKDTSAYCPDGIEGLDCTAYPGSKTVFVGGNNTLSLDVGVPGGQQVYIAPDGSLSYTTAHSAAIPEGSIVTGFERQRSESFGAPVVLGNAGQFWLMCPVSDGEPRERTYQLYVGHGTEDCLNTGVRTYTSTGPDAWEYA